MTKITDNMTKEEFMSYLFASLRSLSLSEELEQKIYSDISAAVFDYTSHLQDRVKELERVNYNGQKAIDELVIIGTKIGHECDELETKLQSQSALIESLAGALKFVTDIDGETYGKISEALSEYQTYKNNQNIKN